MGATAGIVVIGDEILSGKFADENAAFLIGELRSLGVDLRRISVIPDDLDDIADTVARFSGTFTHVFTSGGVGPTHDDLTMAGIARGFGTRVVQAPELEEKVRAYWGEKLAPANLRLAQVPEGAELVYGDAVWPVVKYRNVFVLPGVPALFRRKFLEIREQFRATPMVVARVYAGADEGVLAPHLDAVVAMFGSDVKIGSYPRFEEKDFKVLLTVESKVGELVKAAVEELRGRLGELVVRVQLPVEG